MSFFRKNAKRIHVQIQSQIKRKTKHSHRFEGENERVVGAVVADVALVFGQATDASVVRRRFVDLQKKRNKTKEHRNKRRSLVSEAESE